MVTAEELLRGPRGRRLCLDLAANDARVMNAVFWCAHDLDPNPGTIIRFGEGPVEADPVVSAEDVAHLISTARVDVTADFIATALESSVGTARYWQEPDGRDVLAAHAVVTAALRPIAESVVGALSTDWWTRAPERHWLVQFPPPQGIEHAESVTDIAGIRDGIRSWRDGTLAEEQAARRERPEDPTHPITGSWWSLPGWHRHTVSRLPDALSLVEDSYSPTRARTFMAHGGSRVLEIRTPEDWVHLCGRSSIEVTASRRHDWFRTTGRDGRWVLPDWDALAEHWDGVHLTVAAYLAGAGRALAVDDDRATVIAGWDPDATYWLTDTLALSDEPAEDWVLDDHDRWARAADDGAVAAP